MVLDRIAAVLEESFVEGLDELPMEELRQRRAECQELEEVLSYVRRVVQARLDIVLADLERRSSGRAGDTEADAADLVAKLPEILGERRGGASTRLATYGDPAATSTELVERVDAVVGEDTLARLADLDTTRVEWLAGALADVERSISDGRHSLHQHLDELQAEIVRRYKTGAVSVEEVLRAPR